MSQTSLDRVLSLAGSLPRYLDEMIGAGSIENAREQTLKAERRRQLRSALDRVPVEEVIDTLGSSPKSGPARSA
jgi:hypothetical protein